MQRQRHGEIEGDRLGHDLAVGRDAPGRQAVPAGLRIERRLEHQIADMDAGAPVEADRRLLLDRGAERCEIRLVEPAAEEDLEVRELEPADQIAVPGKDVGDVRQLQSRRHEVVDRTDQVRPHARETGAQRGSGLVVELVERQAGRISGRQIGVGHLKCTS